MSGFSKRVKMEIYERAGGFCEMGIAGCEGRGYEYHHKKSRARGVRDPELDTAKNGVLGCGSCHGKTTRHYPGTEKFRTYSWQPVGKTEADAPFWRGK